MPGARFGRGHSAGEDGQAAGRLGTEDDEATPTVLTRQDFTAKELSEDVYVNKVGTFGISSAGTGGAERGVRPCG